MGSDLNITKKVTVELTGLNAVKYLIDKHDWNIYGSDYDRLSVIAYRQFENSEGYLTADYSWETVFTVHLRMENDELLRTLLGKNWASEVWYESDEWETIDEYGDNIILNAYLCNEAFRNWFDSVIQDYERKSN